ncbi:alpha/beta hydrolase fold domain-containing protein [Granulicella sp. 5B5]|uniref:alpha/beta hydrolase n=1 Tax=Granulicella sp. 5B5 TaxID=1617967 RepID=UPI0015F6C1CC|nr:alpha/beta hydrolase [Granulicella sp. 5B5]QMV18046.1 alpha/beta hydrolase fold domain-containing protein [Granulicella sp. 5B5]
MTSRRSLLLLVPALLSLTLAAQTPATKTDPPPAGYTDVIPLWPAGHVPGAVGTDPVDIPKLYSYPAAGPGPHSAVVVLPGGGYTHLVMDKEGGMEARWLQAHGVSAYVVQYRLWPRYKYPYPLLDGLRAVRYVRAHAKEWGLRPDAVGIWGFSAGGHMSGYLATAAPDAPENVSGTHDAIDQLSAHPDFAILSYARLDLDPKIPGTFGMKTLVGPDATQAQIDTVDPIKHVTAATSPCFIYSTEHDQTVNALNASHFFSALIAVGVPAELHIFEQGLHGTHMGTDKTEFPELAITPTLIQHWLQIHNWMPGQP